MGQACCRVVLQIEKYEFSAARPPAHQVGLAGCRKGRAHVNVQPVGPPESASPPCCADPRTALLYSLPARRRFVFLNWKHGPPARRAGPPFSVIKIFISEVCIKPVALRINRYTK